MPAWIVAALFAMLPACGARTGLNEDLIPTNPEPTDGGDGGPDAGPQNPIVSAVCQCGNCKTVAWCADSVGRWVCDGPGIGVCQCNQAGQHAATAVTTIDRNGTDGVTLFCTGLAEQMTGTQPGITFPGSQAEPDECFARPEEYRQYFNHIPDASICPTTTPYSCDYRLSHGVTWLDGLTCPKSGMLDRPGFCFAGSGDTTTLAAARPVLGAYCRMWGSANEISEDRGAGVPFAPWVCFARSPLVVVPNACTFTTTDGDGGTTNVLHDPGPSPFGYTQTVATGSHLRVTDHSSGMYSDIALTGTASARYDSSGYFLLTDLFVQQVGTATLSSHTFADGWLRIEDLWRGTIDGSGNITVVQSTARAQAFFDIDTGAAIDAMIADAAPTGTRSGSTGTLHAHFLETTPSPGYDLDLYLTLTDSITRPTASITSITTSPLECTSTSGASVTANGSYSNGGGPSGHQLWTLDAPSRVQLVTDKSSATFVVPLAPSGSTTGYDVAYTAYSGDLSATDRRNVLVRDTTAPVNGTPTINLPCGWDTTGGEPNPQVPSLCQTITLNATDTCTATPTTTINSLVVYGPTGAVVQTYQSYTCIAAPAGYLDGNVSNLTWRVRWHATDTWGNNSPVYLTVFQIIEDPANGGCTAHPHHTNILYNGPDPLALYEFDNLPPGAATIPPGLTFTRSGNATVQTSATALTITGITTNVPRVGNDGSGHVGLVFEEPRTNLIPVARALTGTGWSAGSSVTTTAGYATGPDGTLAIAGRSQVSSGGYSNFQNFSTVAAGTYVFSEWVSKGVTAGSFQIRNEATATESQGAAVGGSASYWRRVAVPYTFTGSTGSYPVPADGRDNSLVGGLTARALDNVTDLYQFELGAYATEPIVTTTGSVARGAEVLSVASASTLVDTGRLSLQLRLQPKGGRAAYPAWGESIWYVDGSNWAAIDPSTGTMSIYIGGNGNTAALGTALTWNAGDTLDIYVAAGGSTATVVEYRVNGGTTQVATITGSALGSLTATGAMQLLSYASGYQFTSWTQQIVALYRTQKPLWAL